MSDNIPFEIQTDIIQRITDSKSLIRCRSVSKAWKSVIDSKEFVTAHTLLHQAHNHHLLISKVDGGNYISVVDDDSFPHQKVSVFVPDSIDKVSKDSIVLGCSHGLLGFYQPKTRTAVIWNPCIRKTVETAVPVVFSKRILSTAVGFGVCPRNLDPKLVKITYVCNLNRLKDADAVTHVEVFTLSSGGTWRSPLCSNLPHISIRYVCSPAVIDGLIYWSAVETTNLVDGFRKIIMLFDLTSEEFTKVNLPDPLARAHLQLYNLRQSLAVVELESHRVFNRELNRYNYLTRIYHVWMLIGHGCARSFNKLYSINSPNTLIHTLGFRKSGAHIIKVDVHLLFMTQKQKASLTSEFMVPVMSIPTWKHYFCLVIEIIAQR